MLPSLIPDIIVNTSPDDYRLITSLRPQRFDRERWVFRCPVPWPRNEGRRRRITT
ncbi:hypothetical protein RAD15_02425 [Bradyrhizobium sp. 14AA]